jgi:hypothetical protein
MNFKNFILPEAVISKKVARGTNEYSYEGKWNYLKSKNYKNTKLLSDKLPDHMKLYLYDDIYFLISEREEYLGYIELRTDGEIPRIVYTDSKLSGGFYLIMFTYIFKLTHITEILSDVSLSENAIKSYTKLSKNKSFEIRVYTKNKEYLPFSLRNLKSDELNRVSIKMRG